jgi:hypothetical protein
MRLVYQSHDVPLFKIESDTILRSLKMVSPGWALTQSGLSCFPVGEMRPPGVRYSAKGLVSRILFNAVIPLGAALPRTLISDLPGGFGSCSSRLAASGRCAAHAWLLAHASLPIWSCSVWGLPCHAPYGTRGALLPHLFTLTVGLRHRRYVLCGTCRLRALKRASRTLSGTLPCGVRTFLSRRAMLAHGFRQRPPGPPASV